MVECVAEITSMINNKFFVFGRPASITYKAEVAPKKPKPKTTEEVTNALKTSPTVQAFIRTNPPKNTLPAMSFQDYLDSLKKTMTPDQLANKANAKAAISLFWDQAIKKLGGFVFVAGQMNPKGGDELALYNLRLIAQHDAKYPKGATLYGGYPPGIIE